MKKSILLQIEQHAFRIGDKAQRAGVHLDINATCGKDAWLQCKMDPQMFRASVWWDEADGSGIDLTAIMYGLVWPVKIERNLKLAPDVIELRDQSGRLLIELLCGETVAPAPLGLMTAGE